MAKNTTKYLVLVGTDFSEVRDVKLKKQAAIDLATEVRADEKISVIVVTTGGTIVFEAKARKAQVRTKPYTRVVGLPEGFSVPEGERVAYTRNRKAAAITHSMEEQLYRVRDLKTASVLATFDTTRQCGTFLAKHVTVTDAGLAVVGV